MVNMSKKKESLIALELKEFSDKIKQFQGYLSEHDIRFMDEDKKRHDEVGCQIKIMDALPNWLAALEKLLTTDEVQKKEIEVRGGNEVSGLMKIKMNNDQQ